MLLISLPLPRYVLAEPNASQQAAKERGIVLFNQYKTAAHELRIAAEAGDSEAQFLLAEEIVEDKQYITVDAYKWYKAAAEQGDLYAMLKIGRSNSDLCKVMENCPSSEKKPNEWLEEAESIAKEKAASGDPDALYIMYELTADRSWLEKSANAGNSTAQYRMAVGDRQGEGYILPWKRKQAVEDWFLAAAKNGNPKAMMQLFGIYREKGDLEQARYWVEQSALVGYEAGLYNLGYFLAVEPEKLGFPMDKIKGYGLISLLKVLNGGGAAKTDIEEILPQIESTMSSSELEQAKHFAENWKKEHPPVSYFPEKIRF